MQTQRQLAEHQIELISRQSADLARMADALERSTQPETVTATIGRIAKRRQKRQFRHQNSGILTQKSASLEDQADPSERTHQATQVPATRRQ